MLSVCADETEKNANQKPKVIIGQERPHHIMLKLRAFERNFLQKKIWQFLIAFEGLLTDIFTADVPENHICYF